MMDRFLVILVLIVVYFQSREASKIKTCYQEDLHCVSNLHQQIARGFPEYGIPSAETVYIPVLKIGNCGLTLKNIVVSGIGSQLLNTFRMLPFRRTMLLSFTAEINIYADVLLDIPNHNTWHPIRRTGFYVASANVLEHTVLPFDVIHNRHGVEYFTVGTPTIIGGVHRIHDASLKLKSEWNGKDTGFLQHAHITDEQVITKIVEKAYESVMDNVQSIAKALPRRAFFYNL